MSPPGRLYWTALVLLLTPTPAAGQAASVLLSEGLRAYADLDFAAAAQLLRRALEPAEATALAPPDRLRALMYLGAADLFRDDRDQAVTAFRTLVLADPRFRPDNLVFPPKVTQAFDEVLQTTKAVGLAAPAETRFPAGADGLVVHAYATSRHRIDARVRSARGGAIATLYRGPITDSVALSWNGLDSAGTVVAPGHYDLLVTSSLAPDQVLRSVRLPLDLSARPVDTLPWPQAPQRQRFGWDLRFLVPGAVLGAGLAIPAALGVGGAKGARIAVGLVLGTIGVLGAMPHASAPPARAEAEWRTRLRAAQQENQRRRNRPEIVIRTGPPEPREGPPR